MTVPINPATGWRTRWVPSAKWSAATLISIDGLVVMWIEEHLSGWGATFGIAVSAVITARLVAYIIPNGDR